MSEPGTVLSRDGALLWLTLNRPEKLNAINAGVEQGLRDAIDRLERDNDAAVLVIAARGTYFSAGYDLEFRVDDPHDSGGIALRRRYREIHDLFDRVERVEKPVIAAIQGPCLGGALELCLSCDFRLASTAATFSFPEIALGAVPGSGGTSRTARLVGPGWARWLVMAGETVDAPTASRVGLVQAVHPASELETAVRDFAGRLSRLPREALALAKLTIDLSYDLDRASARDIERLANTILLSGPDYRARVADAKTRLEK